MKGIAIGDLHLDALTDVVPNIIDKQLKSVERVLETSINSGYGYAFFLGDIAERTRLSVEAERKFLKLLHKFDSHIQMYFIEGNHDVAREGSSSLSVFQELTAQDRFKTCHFSTGVEHLQIEGAHISLLSYPHTKPKYKEQHLCFGHFSRPGNIRDNGTVMKKGGVPQKDDNYYVCGHDHTKQKSGRTIYPGTLYQKNFGESEEKGYLTFDYTNGVFKPSWIKHEPEYILREVTLTSKKELKALDDSGRTIYKVYVTADSNIPESALATNPNIYQWFMYRTKSELKTLTRKGTVNDVQSSTIDLLDGLDDFLESKRASSSVIELAKQEAYIARQKIGV